tara:strand:+ start:191 stop:502 length:312 start_codon:yes stop_codon:yes gene_type:complete
MQQPSVYDSDPRNPSGFKQSGLGILLAVQKFMKVKTVSDANAIKEAWADTEFFKTGMNSDEIALGVRHCCRIAWRHAPAVRDLATRRACRSGGYFTPSTTAAT